MRALLVQVLYTVRSERMLMEQLDYNLLFRWFVGLSMDDPVWDPTVVHEEPGPVAGRGRRRSSSPAIMEQARALGFSPTSTSRWTGR